jgi:hypothetical protein
MAIGGRKMNTSAAFAMEPEKDRWWLIGVSVLWQQLIFFCMVVSFPRAVEVSSGPAAIIWLMSFILPRAYLGSVSSKTYLRSCAKLGWLYVLAAFLSDMCLVYFLAFGHGDLFAKLP